MVFIKEGFDSKPLIISFHSRENSTNIEVNVEQEGLNTASELRIQRYETLSYATLDEIIELRNELNNVIAKAVGLNHDYN